MLRSGGGVEKEKVDLTVASSSSLSDHYLHQNLSQLSLTRKSDDHPEGNTHILGLQCTHFDTEHVAMANNILQTTFEAMPYCKVTHHFIVVCS